MSHKGLGIGTYLLAKIIEKVKELYPDYQVYREILSSEDGDGDNLERRNNFYKNRGFTLSFWDQKEDNGLFSAEQASQLNAEWRKDKIEEIPLSSFLMEASQFLKEETNKLENKYLSCIDDVNKQHEKHQEEIDKNKQLITIIIFLVCIIIFGIYIFFMLWRKGKVLF